MKATIILADAASQHPDGTFSLLRGGISTVTVPLGQPVFFHGAFIARVAAELSEAGPHSFEVKVINHDGKRVAPPIQGEFVVPDGGGGTQFIVHFNLALPDYGRYQFALLIDNQESDSWPFIALKPQAETAAQQHKVKHDNYN